MEPGGQDHDGGGGIRVTRKEGIMPGRIVSFFRNLLHKNAVEQALDDELRSSVEGGGRLSNSVAWSK